MSTTASEARPWQRWYWTARWRAVRAAQLKAEPWCKFCLQAGEHMSATVCDHVERHNGDPVRFWSGPFQSLCKTHHDSSKQQAERRGYSGAVDEFGWPIDERHPANSGRIPALRGGIVELSDAGAEHRTGGFVRTVAKLKGK